MSPPDSDDRRRGSSEEPWLDRVAQVSLGIPLTLLAPFVQGMRAVRFLARDPQSRGLVAATGLLLLTGTLTFHWVESFGFLDSLYFSFITLSTIGYGDLVPTTGAGKVLTMVYVVAGLGIIFGFFDAIAAQRLKQPSSARRLLRGKETPGETE